MDKKDFTLLRILKGRLTFRRGDLFLYIDEPSQDLMFDSIDIYNTFYEDAYNSGVYLKSELEELLIEWGFWNPLDDKEIDNIKKIIDNLKVDAYKSYYKQKELNAIKRVIKNRENDIGKLIFKKSRWEHLTCEGVASYARWSWIIENSVYYSDGRKYDWKDIDVNHMMQYYDKNTIPAEEFRYIARNDPWRSMWTIGKKQNNIFNKPSIYLTKDQSMLSSFSSMYDNVYEHPECPIDEIIAEDVCLDGWFIDQKNKNENTKKQNSINSSISNQKIANSKEVFIMANSPKDIEAINSMNSPTSRGIKRERERMINEKSVVTDLDFADVKRNLQTQADAAMVSKARGK